MPRTKRIKELLIEYLEQEGEANFCRLRDHINSKLKYGTTSNQLSNILAKNNEFTKIDMMTYKRVVFLNTYDTVQNNYKVTVWKLNEVNK